MTDEAKPIEAAVPPAQVPVDDEPPPSLKRFLLQAVLWLPLAFFLWYMLRTGVVALPIRLAGLALTSWMPDLFTGIGQEYEHALYVVKAFVGGVGLPSDHIEVTLKANALMYCYGAAVLVGLVMATPLDWPRTFAQLGGGLLVIVPMQALSLAFDALKSVGFDLNAAVAAGIIDAGYPQQAHAAGEVALKAAQATLAGHGVGLELAGAAYQFGYLIIPPIVPVVFWILCNRRFIEQLGARLAPALEPRRGSRGHKPSQ